MKYAFICDFIVIKFFWDDTLLIVELVKYL